MGAIGGLPPVYAVENILAQMNDQGKWQRDNLRLENCKAVIGLALTPYTFPKSGRGERGR